jgi:hypothetical protein
MRPGKRRPIDTSWRPATRSQAWHGAWAGSKSIPARAEFAQRAEKAERIGTRHRRAGQAQHAPAQRGQFAVDVAFAAGRQVGHGQFRDAGADVARQEPAPTVIAISAVDPVAPFLPRFGIRTNSSKRRPRVGQFLDQLSAFCGLRPNCGHECDTSKSRRPIRTWAERAPTTIAAGPTACRRALAKTRQPSSANV